MSCSYSSHYARFHPDTPEHDASLRALLQRWLGPHLPADRNATVLDVGCGRGYALTLLRDLGYGSLRGIEIDDGQVAFARQRGHDVQLVADSVDYLQEHPAAFDLVLLMDVLEHVPTEERAALLGAIHESLRPGGALICTVPNAASPLAGYWRYVDPTHRTLFTSESLGFALEQAGFELERVEAIEFFARPKWLFWLPSRRTLQWCALRLSRIGTRLRWLAELGFERGRTVPLSPNLLARARRR